MTFKGYIRSDGQVGIRNHVVCVATTNCVNSIVSQIAKNVPGVIPLRHTHGCGDIMKSPYLKRALISLCKNPNHYAAIVIGLGCEHCNAENIAEEIAAMGKPVFFAVIQKDGGRKKVIEAATEAARKFVADAKKCKREDAPISKIIFGTECGGSDALSGITANPAIGYVSDWIISQGGTSILTEMAELIGCEKILSDRATNPGLAKEVHHIVELTETLVKKVAGFSSAGVSPGNQKGGITTIQEKSLGCVNKGGLSPVTGIVDYAEPIGDQKGLIILDATNYDPESVAGLFASGAQVAMFSSGRGSPLAFPSCPVIKICSNPKSYQAMGSDIDIDAGAILTEGISLEELGERCIKYLLEVLNGKETVYEKSGFCGPLCIARKLIPKEGFDSVPCKC